MPKGKRTSSPSQRASAETALIEALLLPKNAEEMRRFLRDMCTPQEITALADRWWVARLLDENAHSYRDIHELTGVSITTVGRVARFLQQESYKGYRLVLDRVRH